VLASCEVRDHQGLYVNRPAAKLEDFTGISDVYEPALAADSTIDRASGSVEDYLKSLRDICK